MGRTRADHTLATGESIGVVTDSVSATALFIDVNNKLFHRENSVVGPASWYFVNVAPVYTEQRHMIHGVETRQVVFRAINPATSSIKSPGEAWISEKEALIMIDVSPQDGWKWEVTDILFEEPDPGLFTAPAGFAEMDEQ